MQNLQTLKIFSIAVITLWPTVKAYSMFHATVCAHASLQYCKSEQQRYYFRFYLAVRDVDALELL